LGSNQLDVNIISGGAEPTVLAQHIEVQLKQNKRNNGEIIK